MPCAQPPAPRPPPCLSLRASAPHTSAWPLAHFLLPPREAPLWLSHTASPALFLGAAHWKGCRSMRGVNSHGGHWPEPRVGPCPPASKDPSPELAAPSVPSWQEPWLGQVLPDPPGEVGVLFLNPLPSPATSWPQRGHSHHQPQHFNSWSRSQENGKTDLREPLPQVANLTRPGAQDPSQDGLGDSEMGSTPRSML